MKTLCFSILAVVIMIIGCDPLYKDHTLIHFINNSNNPICFTIPDERHYPHSPWADTTMSSYWKHVMIKSLVGNESCSIACSFDDYDKWIPYDSKYYSLFVFKWEPNKELLENVDEECFRNDEYYIRYDLSLNDIISLCDEDGVLNISYPPTPEMKDIKMWPPYEEAIKNAESLKP